MKETVKSLRSYFFLVGVLGGLGSLLGLGPVFAALSNPGLTGLPWFLVAAFALCGLIQGLICLVFLYFGVNMARLLRDQPERICQVIYASMGISVAALAIQFFLNILTAGGLAYFAAGIAICLYLIKQVRRLSGVLTEQDGPQSVA